jgi:hypothetical protein
MEIVSCEETEQMSSGIRRLFWWRVIEEMCVICVWFSCLHGDVQHAMCRGRGSASLKWPISRHGLVWSCLLRSGSSERKVWWLQLSPYNCKQSVVVHEVCKFRLMNSTGADRQQCGTGIGWDAGQVGDCQVAARASMSIGTALVTHSVLASHELLARWLPRGLVSEQNGTPSQTATVPLEGRSWLQFHQARRVLLSKFQMIEEWPGGQDMLQSELTGMTGSWPGGFKLAGPDALQRGKEHWVCSCACEAHRCTSVARRQVCKLYILGLHHSQFTCHWGRSSETAVHSVNKGWEWSRAQRCR